MKYFNNAIRLALCLTVLLVAGCAVGDKQINEALIECESHGGIGTLWGEFRVNRDIDVICKDGTKIQKDISGN